MQLALALCPNTERFKQFCFGYSPVEGKLESLFKLPIALYYLVAALSDCKIYPPREGRSVKTLRVRPGRELPLRLPAPPVAPPCSPDAIV